MTARRKPNPFNRFVGIPPKPAPGADKRYDGGSATRRVRLAGRLR